MSKLKITIENKAEQVKTCKHEVGCVYFNPNINYYYLVAQSVNSYVYPYHIVLLKSGQIAATCYSLLSDIDRDFPRDILVDAELIIREVQ